MDVTFITAAAQLGGTVFTVVIFLWYLQKRDDKWTRAIERQANSNIQLAGAFQKLIDTITQNTTAVGKNISTVKASTGAVSKNTAGMKNKTERR